MKNAFNEYWNEKNKKLYIDATTMLNYPEIPMGEYFKKIIKPTDTVLDLGCGCGVASLYLHDKCSQIIALDFSGNAIAFLDKYIKNRNIKNIKTVTGNFPIEDMPQADVMIALYVYRLIHDIDSAKAVYNSCKREGILLQNHPDPDKTFHDELRSELGIESMQSRCDNGCYAKELLESLGAKVTCEKTEHEFGQPVDSMEDAFWFLKTHVHAPDESDAKLRSLTPKYVTEREGRLFIPNIRKSCVIHFVK